MYQSQTQTSVKNKIVCIVLNFLFFNSFFFFFFQPHFLVLLYSFLFVKVFVFFNSHWFGMYIFFFQSLSCFFFFLAIRSVAHYLSFTLFDSLRVPFFLLFFLFCFKMSLVFFPKPSKLLFIQPTKFPPQNNSKYEPRIFRYTWFRQISAHILIISKALFPNIFPNKNLIAPPQGGIHKISVCLVRHKKNPLLCSIGEIIRDNSGWYGPEDPRHHLCPQ